MWAHAAEIQNGITMSQDEKKGGPAASLRISTTRFMVFPLLTPYGLEFEKGASADLQGFDVLPDILRP